MIPADAIADELEKIALDRAKVRKRALVAGGALAGGAVAGGAALLTRKGIRADVLHRLKNIGHGAYSKETKASLPKSILRQAKQVADHIRSSGLDPKKLRIAVSGTGGTGKSSFSRALAKELNIKSTALDAALPGGSGSDLRGLALSKYIGRRGIKKGTIAEQTHLINQVSPDKFDVIVRVHRPMKKLKQQILKRGRGAWQLDLYDYPKLHKSIRTAFDSAAGSVFKTKDVAVKVKPPGGFKSDSVLRRKAKKKGVDHKGLRRDQLVNLAAHGKVSRGGVFPYLRKKTIALGVGSTAAGAAAGGVAAHRKVSENG